MDAFQLISEFVGNTKHRETKLNSLKFREFKITLLSSANCWLFFSSKQNKQVESAQSMNMSLCFFNKENFNEHKRKNSEIFYIRKKKLTFHLTGCKFIQICFENADFFNVTFNLGYEHDS